MTKLSIEEGRTLRQLLAAVEAFTRLDRDMPIQMVRLFLLAAIHEGEGTMQLGKRAGLSQSVASRHLLDMGDLNRYQVEGHKLVSQRINPMNRREHPVTLTTKGRGLVTKLVRCFAR